MADQDNQNIKSVVIFVFSVFAVSALFDYPIFAKERLSSTDGWGRYCVMWVPAACAVFALSAASTDGSRCFWPNSEE